MQAVIMAGGRGSRLHPLTANCPKPMLPLAGRPVLAHILDLLKQHYFTEVIITVCYLADQIQAYFGNGRSLGLTIRYALEETYLGTAGSVKNAQPYLNDEPVLVISGDIVTDIDLSRLWQFHHANQAVATLALQYHTDRREYGVVMIDQAKRVRAYVEKPQDEGPVAGTINTGVYVLAPEVLAMMTPGTAYNFADNIFPQLLCQSRPLFGYLTDCYWRDMGTLKCYEQVQADFLCRIGQAMSATIFT